MIRSFEKWKFRGIVVNDVKCFDYRSDAMFKTRAQMSVVMPVNAVTVSLLEGKATERAIFISWQPNISHDN